MSAAQEILDLFRLRALRIFAIVLLILGVGSECFLTKLSVLDPDIWWHLSVGDWIVQHRAFPHNGIFSRTAADHSWMAYSWGYEVLLSRAYDWWSFMGLGLFGTALTIAVAMAVFRMLYRISGRFWVAWALSIVAYLGFLFNIAPRPVFFTVILYTILLTQLFEAQHTGQARPLYWLPLVFLIWANVHIQFVYGLAVIGLFAGMNLLKRLAISSRVYPDYLQPSSVPVMEPFIVLACCVVAGCASPYSFHLYQHAIVISRSKVMYSMIRELQALSFAFFHQWIELLLAVTAYFALGWKKKLDPFKLALLIFASVFAFRTWRDTWFICVTAAAIIADFPSTERETPSIRLSGWATAVVASIFLLLLTLRNTDFNQRGLDHAISGEYPVDAVNFLRRNPVGGPLYNSFDWGGFLIFYMPEYPVSMDGRTDLYGDAMDQRYHATQEAEPSYLTDPILNEAGVVLLKRKLPIAQMLLTDRRFRVIYRDEIALVLARNW